MFDITIIGAGASGLFLGSLLKKTYKKIILEKAEQPGTKLLLSGNGRCNFTNTNCNSSHYVGNSKKRIDYLFKRFGPSEIINYLKKNGIESKQEDNGRILLKSNKSKELLNYFIQKNSENNSTIKTKAEVLNIKQSNNHFIIQMKNQQILSKNVIIACGGKTFPQLGASDFIFKFSKQYKLKTKEGTPALCGIILKKDLSSLSGSSVFSKILVLKGGKTIYSSEGNILFTHRGISGPTVFNISLLLGYFNKQEIEKCSIKIIIEKKNMTKRLFNFLKTNSLSKYVISSEIKGLKDRDSAKVMSGGIVLNELSDDFELKKIPGIFVSGEAIDITGETGGYNLQRCRTSAYCIAKKLNTTLKVHEPALKNDHQHEYKSELL